MSKFKSPYPGLQNPYTSLPTSNRFNQPSQPSQPSQPKPQQVEPTKMNWITRRLSRDGNWMQEETIKQLPKAFVSVLKDMTKPKEITIPESITNPKEIAVYTGKKRLEYAVERVQGLIKEVATGIAGRLFSLPAEGYALLNKEVQMPDEFKLPFTNETVPTLSGIYRQYYEMSDSKALATLATSGVIAGDILVVSYGASAMRPKTKTPVTQQQAKVSQRQEITNITYDDIRNITAGRLTSGPKLNAFQQLSSEGVNWTKLIRLRKTVNPKTGRPYTLKEAYAEGIDLKPGYFKPAEIGKSLDPYKKTTPQTDIAGVGAGVSSSLIAEASKYKSANEFIKAQGTPVYHGTNIKFNEFDKAKLGVSTKAKSAEKGFWFVDNKDVAKGYGEYASEKPVRNILDQIEVAEKSGNWDKAHKLTVKAEELSAKYTDPVVIEAKLNLKNPMIYNADGKGFLATDKKVNDLIDKAIKSGNDSLIIKNLRDNVYSSDIPATHTIVFNDKSILTKSQLTDIYNQAKTTPKITPKTDPLITEAQKYKTADEFIRARKSNYKFTDEFGSKVNLKIKGDTADVFGIYATKKGTGLYARIVEDLRQRGVKKINIELQSADSRRALQSLVKKNILTNPVGSDPKIFGGGTPTTFDIVNSISKSQLTDIWKQAQDFLKKTKEGSIKPAEFNKPIKSNIKASTKAVNSIKPILGNIKAVDPKNKGLIEELSSEIAYRINPKGDLVPAVRQQSGIYAPKEFEAFDFKDIGAKDLNFINFAVATDGINIIEAGNKTWGPMFKMAQEHNVMLADRNEFVTITSSQISKTLRDNKMLDLFDKPKSSDGKIVFELLEGKTPSGATSKHKVIVKELRTILNELRKKANERRVMLGKDKIGYIENYAPHIKKASIWQDILESSKTTISDNFDFIIPNEIKNPHFKKRYNLIEQKETNAFKLFDGYIRAVANDIYVSPMIEQLKAVNSVLAGRELMNANNFINRYIRENLVRKPATLDNYVGLKAGTPARKIVGRLIQARNLGALAGNIVWSLFTQPSSLGLTLMETGPRNLLSGALNYFTNKSLRTKINNLGVSRLKSKTGVGTTLGGDIDRMTAKIYKSPIDNWNEYMGFLSNSIERLVTSISTSAGYSKGKKYNLKGDDLDIYADYVGQVTQSMYNPEARPLALNSMLVRLGFPFQTYMFEAWRHINVLAGKKKGIPKTKQQRFKSIMNLILATFIINYLHKKVRGRKLQTIGSFIPFVGSFIDDQISRITKEKYQSGRGPLAPLEDVNKIREAIQSAVDDGDLKKLRKELVFWSLGMSGIGGAGQINRTIDGIIATEKGYVENIKGERLFDIKGWDAIFSPITGPYGTGAGIEYIKSWKQTGYESVDDVRKRIKKMYDNGEFASEEIASNYILGEIKKRDDRIERILLTYPEDKFKETLRHLIDEGELSKERAESIILKYIEEYTKENKDIEENKNRFNIYQLAPDEETAISQIVKYAQAIGTDPIQAFNLLFKGEDVRKFENGAIIVHRMPLSESEQLRRDMGVTRAITDKYRLDHTIPLQLGGDNTEGNLRLVTTEDWASYTPVENFLGAKLRSGEIGGTKILGIRVQRSKMSLKEAQKLLTDFKDGNITAEEIYNKF